MTAPSTSDQSGYSVLAAVLIAFGWPLGVVLLWASRTWMRRDKVIGTAVLPGLAIVAVAVFVLVGSGIPFGNGGFSALASGSMVALVVAPVITTPYLLVRARRLRARARS